ncbi:pentatricopeptide repeat-containing protein At2g42920, chloroplastic [Aristolochia californica]|uniref:pentatricopeptide repeat-containing protein At2g42920, chloroplastic n=1 Tax=Aristolochia californica TaxID=171875 RepID=UPI0035E063C7
MNGKIAELEFKRIQSNKEREMSLLCSGALPSSTSISKFISDNPCLTLLEHRCKTMRDLKMLHAQIIKTGLAHDKIAISRVLSFCATSSSGDINYALLLFSRIEHPNLFAWNTIIRAFSNSSTPHQAISLFYHMLHSTTQPQRLTFPSLFKAYSRLGLSCEGTQIHGMVTKLGFESDPFIRNSMISMYAVCGDIVSASHLFDENSDFDVVAWNSMMLGLARVGQIEESRRLFDEMPSRSNISWNSMISGYVRNGLYMEALNLFRQMQEASIGPTVFTIVSLLAACGRLGSLEQGKWLHAYIEKNGIEINVIVLTAIIDMYCKCGSADEALRLFEAAPVKGLSSWNSIISGLAMDGRGQEAVRQFSKLQMSGLRPDYVSFIGVLTACSHSGMVDKGRYYFSLMTEFYKIEPMIKHYGCMVDILGRAGFIEEAEELIRKMPMDPDVIIWGSLLSACRTHGNITLGEQVAKRIIELDSGDNCGYILLSNAYAAVGRFSDTMEVRSLMKGKRMRKETGCSLIEVNGVVHEFVVGGTLHLQSKEIYALLDELGVKIMEAGHVEYGTENVYESDNL